MKKLRRFILQKSIRGYPLFVVSAVNIWHVEKPMRHPNILEGLLECKNLNPDTWGRVIG